jgi:hypothetical protein
MSDPNSVNATNEFKLNDKIVFTELMLKTIHPSARQIMENKKFIITDVNESQSLFTVQELDANDMPTEDKPRNHTIFSMNKFFKKYLSPEQIKRQKTGGNLRKSKKQRKSKRNVRKNRKSRRNYY